MDADRNAKGAKWRRLLDAELCDEVLHVRSLPVLSPDLVRTEFWFGGPADPTRTFGVEGPRWCPMNG